jgi:hypothetical protein
MNEGDKQRIRALFPHASDEFLSLNLGFGLCAKADKPTPRPALECPVAGTEESDARPIVSYVLYRCRPLDPDAIHGATKVCTDCLCKIGLLAGDSEKHIRLEVTQEKVAHMNEQRTTLKITYP